MLESEKESSGARKGVQIKGGCQNRDFVYKWKPNQKDARQFGESMITKGIFSKATDHWSTPIEVYDTLNKEFGFDFDPCPLQSEDKTYLLKDWGSRCFVNPPYSNIYEFINKALVEIKRGNTEIAVFLVPSRTGTKWWHDLVVPYHREIRFIRGRLKFGGSDQNAPFDSVIVVFKTRDDGR